MPASVEIISIPIGSQLVRSIGANDPDDLNDFDVLLLFDENVNLTQSGVSVSAGSSIVALEGAHSVYKATVRPPETSGIVTVTVAANAVNVGNSETSKDIRLSTRFPDADAETPTELFAHSFSNEEGIAVTSNRIIINNSPSNSSISLVKLTHAGVQQSSETLTGTRPNNTYKGFHAINGDFIIATRRYRVVGNSLEETARYSVSIPTGKFNFGGGITFSELGISFLLQLRTGRFSGVISDILIVTPDSISNTNADVYHEMPQNTTPYSFLVYYDGLFFIAGNNGSSRNEMAIAELTDDGTVNFLKPLNVDLPTVRGMDTYRGTLYMLTSDAVQTLDIRKYRPIAKNTKSTIYPIFAESGDTIDLTQFSPDAERFTFDVGFKKPPYLSINASNELVIGSGAETVFVKLKAINRIDATETESFGFYLIIRRATAPIWRNVSALTMRAGSSYDLFQLVDADSIAFRSGRPRPTGSSLANGVFTVGTVGGVSHFTARKGSRSSHIEINIDVVQGVGNRNSLLQKKDVFRYRVEIAGIDVTPDLVGTPSVSETLDPIIINEYRVNEASIVLRNEGGKYNSDLAGNFWETHGLNAGGFQDAVKIYTEHFDGRGNLAPTENLLFTGLINESFEPIGEATFKLNCTDISSRLRKALAQDFGTLEKWDSLRKQSDEDSFEGTYIPERSLLPMQVGTGMARSDRTDLDISRLELPSEGPAEENTAYMTPMELKTAGGFLDANPLLRFKTDHRSEDVRFLINQLATNKEVYNTEIDIPGVTVDKPFLLNRGSVAFSVGSPTRTTRLPVDWVHDSTNSRVLILLSNPERHIADLLVQYDIDGDSYRVLHTFDKDTAVHRIERRNATNYYILTSAKITQDRSAGGSLPRPSDGTGYASDSLAEGSGIKIYRYSTSTGTLTEHVAEDDNHPPQLGIHYHVGFDNDLNIDAFEGIRPDYRGAFRWYSNNLYYRYAKDGEFGVARVNTSGTTTKMIGQAVGKYQNHLNFAFDINSSGSIYFVYVTGDTAESTLVIKRRTSGGTETTILEDQKDFSEIKDLNDNGGAYLGVHECLFHNNFLYMLVPIQQPIIANQPSFSFRTTNQGVGDAEFIGFRYSGTGDLSPGDNLYVELNWDRTVSGLNSSEITVMGATLRSLVRSGSRTYAYALTVTLDALLSDVVVVIPEDTLSQGNGATRIVISFRQRDRTRSAGMVLYRCNVTAGSPSLTAVDTWDFVHQAGCNLIVHDGSVHFTEQPSAATRFKPINPDLDGYWTDDERKETMGYNIVEESLGALKRISNTGEVESLGNVWYTDRPFNVFPTRMLSIAGDLHLCAGYGNLDELLRFNSLASGADNVVHIVYGKTLHYVLPTFQPNGRSIYAALAGLAKSVNATLSFRQNIVFITDRRPFRAVTDGATGTGTADIGFSDANKRFPSSGYLLIGKEILRYTGISSGAFTGITRGVLGSEIENQVSDASAVLYLDNIIQTEGLGSPYKKITLQSDTNRIFNIIRDSGGVAEVRDAASIAKYGERPYTLDLGLTRHEKAWIEEIFRSYLEDLSELQQIANIQTIPDFSLRLGQIVPFFYKGLLSGMRIVSVRYEKNTTHIKGRTVG